MRRLALLISCSAFALNAMTVTLPTGARAEDDPAALLYWKLPFSGAGASPAESAFGFRIEASYDDRLSRMSERLGDDAGFVRPPLFDMQFSDQGVAQSLSFGGVETMPMLSLALGFHNPEAPEDKQAEQHLWMALGGVAAAAIFACVFFCGEGGDGGDSGDSGDSTGDDDDDDPPPP